MTVSVKALRWTDYLRVPIVPCSKIMIRRRAGHHDLGPYAGCYVIEEKEPGGEWVWRNTWAGDYDPGGIVATEEDAMLAAQADFDSRIRSVATAA